MGVQEYEVTKLDRRGNPTTTTVLLSEEDAQALGDAAKPVGQKEPPTKARKSPNKARSPRAK